MHHNTTHESGQLLLDYQEQAKSQEEAIYRLFQQRPDQMLTPFEVKKIIDFMMQKDIPITSIRRAMTDLTKEGKLRRTKAKVIEQYNRPNYYWTLNHQYHEEN